MADPRVRCDRDDFPGAGVRVSGAASKQDGIRAVGGRPKLKGASDYRLRVAATVTLGSNAGDAITNRAAVADAMLAVQRVLAEQGIGFDFLVGQPRSPEDLQASLLALVDPRAELEVA